MAIATSMLHRSFKGAIGDFIFRTYNGKTVVSLRPVYKNETNTEPRRQARGRFREAAGFASQAMTDAKQKAYYTQKARQLKLPNAYTAALTDYLRKAKVAAITPPSFAAKRGDVIQIKVTKPGFKMNKIRVKLHDKNNTLLSEQTLMRHDIQRMFDFKLTDDFPDYSYLTIVTDEPLHNTYTVQAADFVVLPAFHTKSYGSK